MKGVLLLVVGIILVLLVQYFGGIFTDISLKQWYPYLIKPVWTPPNWVFGPVWTILYILMVVSLYLAWRKKATFWAYFFWGLQLALNLLWSYLFFTLRNPLAGLIEMSILWIAILITIILFARFSAWAAILLIPYLGWVTYALFLNYMIWKLN